MKKNSFKIIWGFLIILICILAFAFNWFNYQVATLEKIVVEQQAELTRFNNKIEYYEKEIQNISEKTQFWQEEINKLYEMNKSHANCVAMAVLMNEESVLADFYNRSEQEQIEIYNDDSVFANFYGRLYIPDAKIDVALYIGTSQRICDRQDSANIFSLGIEDGETIADHNNQEFRKLFSVKIGTEGYIVLENGDIINIICTDVFNGHNTGYCIIDEEGNNVMDDADYLMYTCRNGWRNVLICLWEKI